MDGTRDHGECLPQEIVISDSNHPGNWQKQAEPQQIHRGYHLRQTQTRTLSRSGEC